MLAIVDYGMGNLKSVANALEGLSAEVTLTRDSSVIEQAEGIILPGVGAFGEGMRNLHTFGLVDVLRREVIEKKKPYLGICLGLQFLAHTGYEDGESRGLGWVNGTVKLIEPKGDGYKVPHMGWNNVKILKKSEIFAGLKDDPVFYFVHSYGLELDPSEESIVTSVAEHGCRIIASIQKGHIFATQFHPEKSQSAGLMVLKNFISYCKSHAQA
ncbi:imidazole glycerol phosphate synthase subunit HisH [Candidatus Peregrinibacteria bacterium]|nr:imidazole glycerol phosphate synthase subunit HisH [Candidatus Peregrinibacteria bacterium]